MTRRRLTWLTIKRAAATFLVAAALLLQGIPLAPALSASAVLPAVTDEATPPCHEAGADPSPAQEQPAKSSMTCCSAAICGMMGHALPPVPAMPMKRLAAVFAPPFERLMMMGQIPDPAWRPPATFL